MKKLFAFLIAFHLMIVPMRAHAFIPGVKQLTGIAIAGVGVSLAAACKLKSPSLLTYLAGAAAYLMGEMKGGKEHDSQVKENEKDVNAIKESGAKGGEVQLASLEAQLKDKEQQLKFAKSRSTWIGASMALFTAATAMAALEILPESLGTLPPLGCEPGTAIGLGTIKTAAIVGAYSYMAGGSLMQGLLGAAAGYAVAQGALASAFNTATGRVIAMTAVTALVLAAKSEVDGKKKKLEEDIKNLKDVIAQFKKETDGKGPNTEDTSAGAGGSAGSLAGTTSGASGGQSSGSVGGTITALPDGTFSNGTTTCLTSNQEFSTNCSNNFKVSTPNLNILGNQPELQQVANQGAEFANAATSGEMGKADIAAASLSASIARMDEIKKKAIASANSKLQASGKKPINVEKESQALLKSMQSAFDKEVQSKGVSLASLGGNPNLDPAKIDASGQNIATATVESGVALPDTKAQQVVGSQETISSDEIAAAANGKNDALSAADALGKNLDDYETSENDISKNSEASLWKQVSNRYLLNYDRFFERKKVPAPAQ